MLDVGNYKDYSGKTNDGKFVKIGQFYYEASGIESKKDAGMNGAVWHYNIKAGTKYYTLDELKAAGYSYSSGIEKTRYRLLCDINIPHRARILRKEDSLYCPNYDGICPSKNGCRYPRGRNHR